MTNLTWAEVGDCLYIDQKIQNYGMILQKYGLLDGDQLANCYTGNLVRKLEHTFSESPKFAIVSCPGELMNKLMTNTRLHEYIHHFSQITSLVNLRHSAQAC